MKAAITGGNGFLARYCIDLFEQNDIIPVLITRKDGKYKEYDYHTTDYTKDSLKELFCKEQIDAIVHLAGPRIIYPNISQYSDYFDMTTAIYDAAVENGIQNIVFASSISVYSGTDLPYKEDCVLMPDNNYGLSKIICEQIGNMYSRFKGLNVKNLRFAHLYGANENNKYMINTFLKRAFNHEQLNVFCRGNAHRELMYTKDAALAVICALNRPELSGTYNIGSNDALTTEQVAGKICSYMSPENSVIVGSEVETIKSSYMDNTMASRELGFSAEYKLETALPEIYIAMKENLEA